MLTDSQWDTIEYALKVLYTHFQIIARWGTLTDAQAAAMQEADATLAAVAAQRSQGQGPMPNWDDAPEWAQWWAVDPDGYYHWFDNEPILTEQTSDRELIGPHWSHWGRKYHLYDAINIPLGVDWRTLKRQRPTPAR